MTDAPDNQDSPYTPPAVLEGIVAEAQSNPVREKSFNFALEIIYGGAMVFFVVTPGSIGPLGAGADGVPFEMMVTRRLYAAETWIAILGLSIYLGVTEVLPRRLAHSPAA